MSITPLASLLLLSSLPLLNTLHLDASHQPASKKHLKYYSLMFCDLTILGMVDEAVQGYELGVFYLAVFCFRKPLCRD